jgi:hypothetical protein
MPGESIYPESCRLAQPDEVWNYGRGDGLEKALTLANILRSRDPEARFAVEHSGKQVVLVHKGGGNWSFPSDKSIVPPGEKDFDF